MCTGNCRDVAPLGVTCSSAWAAIVVSAPSACGRHVWGRHVQLPYYVAGMRGAAAHEARLRWRAPAAIRRRPKPHRLLLPRRRDGRYLEARTRELPRAARQDGGAAGNLSAVVRPSLRLGGRCRAHGTIKRDKIRLLGFTRYTTSTLRSTAMLGPSLSHPDSLISLDKKDKIVLSDLFFLQPCKGT